MAKSEIGTIIDVIKEGRPQYKVRLDDGPVVIVDAGQVSPARLTLLPRGTRLRVTHDLGKVEAASTELTLELRGQVKAVLHQAQGPAYRLDMEQGEPRLVRHSLLAPPPPGDLQAGAVLALTLENGQVKTARLVSERFTCQVLNVDPSKNVVRVRSSSSVTYNVRLDPAELRRISPGDQLEMEIVYAADGGRKIILQTPPPKAAPVPQAQPPSAGRGRVKPAGPAQPTKSAPQPEPRPAPAEAEIVGLDPVYFEQRKREGHRFEIMSFLEEHKRDGLVEWYRLKPGKAAEYARPQRPLPPVLEKAIAASVDHFHSFFSHQSRALDAIRSERNLVMVTQTASGKTLGYNPGIFEYLLEHPTGHALYLFPLNALMTDQKEKIDQLVAALAAQGARLSAEMLLGGMSDQRATLARSSPNILATNPEMLGVVLNEAVQWQAFFSGLKYIVIDEVHSYRGIFGLHMAGLVRRLLITARRYGAEPRCLISSATVSNPLDLAERLTSLPADSFELLQEDGSAQASKHWTVLNPDWGSAASRYDNYLSVAAAVFVELVTRKNARGQASPLNTLLFCRSIRDVNRAAKQIRDTLARQAPGLVDKVKAYVSASLSIQEKREIYARLRSGSLIGVVSTNALEAGIDIGKLDAGIIAGFPFSVMAMRQMAGRIGRQNEGLVCFVPHPLSSLDQYYREAPEHLLTQPPELFVIDPHNPYIARKHINAVAQALGGLPAADLERYWGGRGAEIARQAAADGAMSLKAGRWLGTRRNFNNPDDVYAVHNIRSNASRPYAVCLDDAQPCNFASGECLNPTRKTCPRQVTTLDREYIYRDCHPGAIYEATTGKLYRVTRFDDRQRVVRVVELPDSTLERTYVEEDTSVEIGKAGEPQKRRRLADGIELAWGEVTVTRLFTGYYRYTLIPARRCRYCHREYEGEPLVCPRCRRATEGFFNRSRPERIDFPEEHQLGFQIVLKTSACWLTVRPEIEDKLEAASPCKLPGDQNKVLRWLKKPLDLNNLPVALKLTEAEKSWVQDYYARAAKAVADRPPGPQEAQLFPGLYGQCLLAALRAKMPEGRALELYQALSGYPVTEDLRHVCRKCQTSSLFPAMHTLEHSVVTRYPSVALGDPSDLGTFTTLGHSQTGLPSVFWFDDYEGGLGAAEKVYDVFGRLVELGAETIQACACTTLEGCPRCTYLGGCSEGNAELSKAAGVALAALIRDKPFPAELQAFLYRKKRQGDFDRVYDKNEYGAAARGVGEEAPQAAASTPNVLLRVQSFVHRPVLLKAFEVRSQEIDEEVPPLSATALNAAFNEIQPAALAGDWHFEPALRPYEVLEVLPNASLRMIQQVYRVIALQVHPDRNPGKTAWANEMMKILNDAYDRILKERG
jgi:DEAD/DEAH box helicase domain-containing protein